MKLLVKNLHNEECKVDCDGDDSIKELKEKIASQNKFSEKYDPELLKLLYKGKVMEDENSINNYSMEADDHVVLIKQMPGKPKPPPKKKNYSAFNNPMGMGGFGSNDFGTLGAGGFNTFNPNGMMQSSLQQDPFSASAFPQNNFAQAPHTPISAANQFKQSTYVPPATANQFQQSTYVPPATANQFQQSTYVPPATANQFKQPAYVSPATANQFKQPAYAPPSSSAGATGSGLGDANPEDFSTPEDRANALQCLLSMGFQKDICEKALRASFYNVEAAVEYITSGKVSKSSASPMSHTPASSLPSKTQTYKPTPTPSAPTSGGGDANAHLQQINQMLQNNPEQLQMVKESLRASHPEIAEMIDSDPQAFLKVLGEATGHVPAAQLNPSHASHGANPKSPRTSSAAQTATFSVQEEQMISRMQDMGFDRNRVIEAFLLANRDEQLAVNYLLG